MQSENGILLLFYIFLSQKKRGGRVYKGGMLCPVHKYLWIQGVNVRSGQKLQLKWYLVLDIFMPPLLGDGYVGAVMVSK
jgi:hypothetical protein